MTKRTTIYASVVCLLLVLFFGEKISFAAEEDNLGYTVNLVQPKTQIDPKKSYFYIQTKPGEAQTLEVRVKSTRKEPIALKIYGSNAITGDNGTIEYSTDTSVYDPTLKEPLTSMLKIETPEITVGNFEERTVKIQVRPPKANYKGIKMGVLVFEIANGKESKSGITTEFSYRVGLITTESGDEFNNAQSLNLNSVKAAIKRGKKMVLANLQNPEPKVLENLSIVATMTKKGSEEVVKRKTVENYSLAPNSRFDFEMDWGVDALPSGSYVLNLEASNDYQEWHLSKEFTITNQQAKKINKESAFKIITPSWIKVSTIFLFALTIFASGYSIWRRSQWKKQWKKIRFAKKRKKGKLAKNKKLNKSDGE